jgi:hypothetical protein
MTNMHKKNQTQIKKNKKIPASLTPPPQVQLSIDFIGRWMYLGDNYVSFLLKFKLKMGLWKYKSYA